MKGRAGDDVRLVYTDDRDLRGMVGAWLSRRALARAQERALVRAGLENGRDLPMRERAKSKLPGDERALRGIPVCGRGVSGAIRGTRPGERLWQDRESRL